MKAKKLLTFNWWLFKWYYLKFWLQRNNGCKHFECFVKGHQWFKWLNDEEFFRIQCGRCGIVETREYEKEEYLK